MKTGEKLADLEFAQNVHIQAEPSQAFSPRKVATSIGVSESSLKRWCDAGFLRAIKTAGGHRRIPRSEVIAFVKRKNLKLINPETIGLPVLDDIVVQNPTDAVKQLCAALMSSNSLQCKKLLDFLYLDGWEVAAIFDQVVAPTFEEIGVGWSEGRVEVFEERQACQTCFDAITHFKSILPLPETNAVTAIGGAIEHDQYDLPTQAVEVTLASLGCNASSLGNNLPLESLLKAAQRETPGLFWVSCSYLKNPTQALVDLNEFASAMPSGTTLVVGGNAIDAEIRSQIKDAICFDNLSQLAALVRKIQPLSDSHQNFGN